MRIIHSNILPPKGYKAITILNVIFVRKGCDMTMEDVNHENIHWEQEKELAFVGFYLCATGIRHTETSPLSVRPMPIKVRGSISTCESITHGFTFYKSKIYGKD